MLCSALICSSKVTVLLSNLSLSSPARTSVGISTTSFSCTVEGLHIRMSKLSPQGLESRCVSLVKEGFQDRTPGWIAALKAWVWTPPPGKSNNHTPQMKQVVFRISSFLCFSLLKSANVSMMTPKIRFRTMMMTTKKNRRS